MRESHSSRPPTRLRSAAVISAAARSIGSPSIHSVVSTRVEESDGTTAGTANSGYGASMTLNVCVDARSRS